MQFCILSLHITGIICISHMIKYLWKMSRDMKRLISPWLLGQYTMSWGSLHPRLLWTIFLLVFRDAVGVYNEDILVAVHFIPSLLAQKDIQGPSRPGTSPGETLNPKGIPSAEPALRNAGVTPRGWRAWLHLALPTHALHIPTSHVVWLSLQKLESFWNPLSTLPSGH